MRSNTTPIEGTAEGRQTYQQSYEFRPSLTDAKGACQVMGIGLASFYRHISPTIPVVRIGRRALYRVADLDALIERRAAGL